MSYIIINILGWALKHVSFLEVNINKYNPLFASSYIRLPKSIENKRAVLNIRNNDDKCFAYAVNAAIFPANGPPDEVSSYPHYSTLLRFDGINFPVKLNDIHKFEILNNISINVFGINNQYKDGKMVSEIVGPLHFTNKRQNTHVNLLLVTDIEGNTHYTLIKDLSRLVSRQRSKHHGRNYICDGCLLFFYSPEKLHAHEKNDCNHLCTILPDPEPKINKCGELIAGNILKFVNFEKQLSVPFVIYADFESLLKPIHCNEPSDSKSFSVKTYQHEPYSFCIYLKCNFDDNLSKLEYYRGIDAVEVFVKRLDELVLQLYQNHLKNIVEMKPLSQDQQNIFNNSQICHICDNPFENGDEKVRDHCHLTGNFRGAAHSHCNLNFKIPTFIPVFFHNLTNYDSHLFIKKLALKKESIQVLAQNKEKYITFSKQILVDKTNDKKPKKTFIKLRFVDSFRFLPASLDKLSQTLETHQCVEVRKFYTDDQQFNLLRRKGVFPYSYVDSMEKLDDAELPSRDEFFNILSGESISQEDYDRACDVWNTFNCRTLGEYSDIYLISDVLLLADIFENFRQICLQIYKLDPAQYLTAPSLSWDAMLRKTGIELELLTDIDMLHFFRKGIRGGVSQCSNRKAIANNPFIPNYNPSEPNSYILYLDATNLYGCSMSQCLPTGDFRWLNNDEIENFDCSIIDDNSPKGYILEVDLEYPQHLHDKHNDLPFCPENIVPPDSKNSKLILNLHDKQKYILHYRNLKQCLEHGLILKKIHRIVEFSQSAWLKAYIDLNTELRNSSKNAFERDFFKFLINSIFGKTMENVDNRVDVKLVSHWRNSIGSVGAEGLIAKPNFKSCTVFSENLVAIQMSLLKIFYDKPLYVGFTILDISKTIIYNFFYNFIKKQYGDKASLCYTDTDSLILQIHTNNVYDDIKENIELFDTSNFSIPNVHNIPKTQSVVGKMKDEYSGMPIEGFFGTGAKAYCVKVNDSVIKKAKGVTKSVIKNQLHLVDYKQIVEDGGLIYRKMYVFSSHLHTIYTELKNKVALSAQDDKRYVIPGSTKTLAWGHYSIRNLHSNTDHNTPEDNLTLLLRLADEIIEQENHDIDFDLDLL